MEYIQRQAHTHRILMVRCGPISWHGVPLGHLLVANWIGTVLGGPGRLSGAPQRIKVKFTAWVGHQLKKSSHCGTPSAAYLPVVRSIRDSLATDLRMWGKAIGWGGGGDGRSVRWTQGWGVGSWTRTRNPPPLSHSFRPRANKRHDQSLQAHHTGQYVMVAFVREWAHPHQHPHWLRLALGLAVPARAHPLRWHARPHGHRHTQPEHTQCTHKSSLEQPWCATAPTISMMSISPSSGSHESSLGISQMLLASRDTATCRMHISTHVRHAWDPEGGSTAVAGYA